jgi:hypothetical protein
LPTTSARSSRGTWALYPTGPEVLVVHPDGTVSGSAAEVGRLAAHDRHGDLDRQAAQTIQHLLTGDGTDHAGPRLLGARTWAIPAKAYWLSGPDNHHVGLRRRRAGPFRGVNVNVTLLFSVERYEQVIEAYLTGLERRVDQGEPIDQLRSVASFFVSRVDTKADAAGGRLAAARRVAIANAQLAYARYRARSGDQRWARLARQGASPQRPLWASTGTKDPAFSDVLYVERLIAPGVINTMPEQTLRAFAQHGNIGPTLEADPAAAEQTLAAAATAGVDLSAITAELVGCIESKRAQLTPAAPA